MRITGGEWVRRAVAGPPRTSDIRPTPDALREQAFAVLGESVRGAAFLDFYGGTGVVSLEALSRGAARVVTCERSAAAQRVIRDNVAALGVAAGRWELHAGGVEQSVDRLARQGLAAARAWCDPPFAEWASALPVLTGARELGVLAPGARVVLEVPPKAVLELPGFEVLRQLRGALLLVCSEAEAGPPSR
jgi:16S rRNA (guanine966-N2)-methyltransferase